MSPSRRKHDYFLPQSKSAGLGLLEMVEWFKEVFSRFHGGRLLLADPFFDEIGLELLSLSGCEAMELSVITTTAKKAGAAEERQSLLRPKSSLFKANSDSRLRIFMRPDQAFHDRYLLLEKEGEVEGFHLSNSLQGAAQKNPLLITPIPGDVLPQVKAYVDGLISGNPALDTQSELPEASKPDWLSSLTSPSLRKAMTCLYDGLILRTENTPDWRSLLQECGILQDGRIKQAPSVSVLTQKTDKAGFAAIWEAFTLLNEHADWTFTELQERLVPVVAQLQPALVDYLTDQWLKAGVSVPRDSRERLGMSFERLVTSRLTWWRCDGAHEATSAEKLAVRLLWGMKPELLLSVAAGGQKALNEGASANDALRLFVAQTIEESQKAEEDHLSREMLPLWQNGVPKR